VLGVVVIMGSFLTFFHSLLSEGIIPEKEDFHVFVWYGNGHGSGKDIHISNKEFRDPIFNHLDDATITRQSKVELCSMYYEFIMEYLDGEWHLTKEWYRPDY
jgi:hypothetical protein